MINVYDTFVSNPEEKNLLRRRRRRWECNIKFKIRVLKYELVNDSLLT